MKKYFYYSVIWFLLLFSLSACERAPHPDKGPLSREVKDSARKQKEILDDYYSRALQITPQSPHEYMTRGFGHYYFQQFDKAREDFIKARGMYKARADFESAEAVDRYIDLLPPL